MNFNAFLIRLMYCVAGNIFVRILFLTICADMIFGSLRAAKERKWNSAIGIDGGIRKVAMVACVLMLTVVDMIMSVNVLGWLPMEYQEALGNAGIVKLAICELWSLLFICYELTSVLKNLLLCGVPIPAGLRKKLTKWLDKMTDETNALSKDTPET